MKKLRLMIASIACAALSMAFCFGCNNAPERYVTGIEKSSTDGLVNYYTVTYNDGTTSVISVTDGKDGQNVTAAQLFDAYKELHPDATYEDFLETIATINLDGYSLAVNRALRSSLKIYTEFTEQSYSGGGWFPSTSKDTNIYSGSAVIWSMAEDYTYLVTNYHVVYDEDAVGASRIAKKITAYLYGSDGGPEATDKKDNNGCTVYDYGDYAIDCTYVGGCVTADLAVVKASTADVKKINDGACAVTPAFEYHVGQPAIAIGNAEDDGISVTQGIISTDNEFISLNIDSVLREYRSIRIDTPIYHGNSGGGLFDADGRLIGITNAGDEADQNINFAVPLDIVNVVVGNILYYSDGTVKKPLLGVTVATQNTKYVYDGFSGYGRVVEDILVRSVVKGSIAEAIGLSVDDILCAVTVNGNTIALDRYFRLGDITYTLREGDVLSVTYKRGGEQKESEQYTVKRSDINVVD